MSEFKKLSMVFVSVQDLWGSAEIPERAPGETLIYYINNGNNVTIITPNRKNLKYRTLGVDVILLCPWLLRINSSLLRRLGLSLLFPLLLLLFWTRNKELNRKTDILYGYEVHGVLSGAVIKYFFKIPLISRFQGTILYPILSLRTVARIKFLKNRLIYFDHFEAFKRKADLAIITDDGTFGDRVMNELNPKLSKRSLFLKNGLNIKHDPRLRTKDMIIEKFHVGSCAKLILTVSRLVEWKRVDRAIETMRLLKAKKNNYKLLIVGCGDKKQALQALVDKYELKNHVFFVGRVDNNQLKKYYHAVDVFLSLYDLSNVGNPLLEALNCGCPVITLNNGNTSSVIKNWINGVLLESSDPIEISNNIIRVIEDTVVSEQLRMGALKYAANNLMTWNDRIEKEFSYIKESIKL